MNGRAGLLQLAMSGPQPTAADVEQLLAVHGSIWGDAKMTGPDGDPTGGTGGGAGGAGDDGKKFSQAEMDRVAARRADEGERAGRKALLEQLGLPADTKPEDLKARLDAIQAADEAKKDEATKAKDAADAARAASDKEKQGAVEARHAADVEKYLLRAGLGKDLDEDDKAYDDKLAKAISRAAKLVDVEVGADGQKIRDAIADLKKDMPALFAGESGGGKQQPDGDAAAQTRKAKDSKVSGVDRGKAKAAELGWRKEKQTV